MLGRHTRLVLCVWFPSVIVPFKRLFVFPKLIGVYFIRVSRPLARRADCDRISATTKTGDAA
jgi:hypothetical protein